MTDKLELIFIKKSSVVICLINYHEIGGCDGTKKEDSEKKIS